MFYYVSEHEAWADKIYKRFVNLRTDYQKLEHQRDPSHPLTACQQWKLTDLSYLKTFYKQGHKSSRRATSRTSTEHSSDEEADDRGHESSSSSRRETPTKMPVPNAPMPTRRPKKRRDDRTDSEKDEIASKLNKIVGEESLRKKGDFAIMQCHHIIASFFAIINAYWCSLTQPWMQRYFQMHTHHLWPCKSTQPNAYEIKINIISWH